MKKFFRIIIFMASSITLGQSMKHIELKIETEEFIFNRADFNQCHSSTLVALDNGEILAAWFGGPYERHPEVSIYTARKRNPGGKWSQPEVVANGVINDSLRFPTWNPVLYSANSEKLFLFYKVGPSPSEWWGMYKTSTNNGKSWSEAVSLPQGILGPVKNKPVEFQNNILSPSSTESKDGKNWRVHMEISTDQGTSWFKIPIDTVSKVKAIQPTILKLRDGSLKVLVRSNQDFILESSSKTGLNWSILKKTDLPNPNSGIDAVTMSNGMHLLVYNPAPSGNDWSDGRNSLYLALSEDGDSWMEIYKFEDRSEGEFSYPAIIQDKDGNIHVTYTYNRNKIKYLKFKLQGL